MIALLKKDIFVMDKQMRVLVILALVFLLMPTVSSIGSAYAVMISLMLPMSTISYDERCKWDRYAAMLPWTPRQIVGSKYILHYGAMAMSMGLIVVGTYIRSLYSEEPVIWEDVWHMLAMYVVILAVLTVVIYPLLYRFGTERGRLILVAILMVIFLVTMGAGYLVVENIDTIKGRLEVIPAPVLVMAGAVLLAGANVLSYHLSVKLYLRRRDGRYA